MLMWWWQLVLRVMALTQGRVGVQLLHHPSLLLVLFPLLLLLLLLLLLVLLVLPLPLRLPGPLLRLMPRPATSSTLATMWWRLPLLGQLVQLMVLMVLMVVKMTIMMAINRHPPPASAVAVRIRTAPAPPRVQWTTSSRP